MKRDYFFKILFWGLLFSWPAISHAQEEMVTITLANPSFEDIPRCCEPPRGWYNCGTPGETAPDVQPGAFEVSKAPSDGETYVGLVVRDNETWESIGQRIPTPIEKGKCYEFSLDLARAELYISLSRTTGETVNYATPAKLRIYGGNGYEDKRELLAQTSVIKHPRWLTYNLPLRPKKGNYSYIILEAYYNTPILFPYNGNILIDNASAIVQVDCDAKKEDKPKEEPPALAQETKKGGKKPTARGSGTNRPTTPPITYQAEPEAKFKGVTVRKNSVVQLEKIYFDADKYSIREDVEPALLEIYDFLTQNPKVIVEIGGHTNDVPADEYCDQLSASRAKAVSDWLISKGILPARVQFKGYGKRAPIASNKTANGRKRNQRVEIKILSLEG